ncbi:MAG: RNA polymerase factor sigma-54 [Gracilibacteraceae bacterium]|nr:RNA polymerase factor sigma-54 [Gracilibacteraceae bacterium]
MRQARQGLYLEQRQRLYMTTELKQAISVLQMSALELGDYITRSMEENPFLEENDGQRPEYESESEAGYPARVCMDALAEEWRERGQAYGSGSYMEGKEEYPFEKYLSRRVTLEEHLRLQLRLEARGREDFLIGEHIIGSIDRNGYLCATVAELAGVMGVSPARVEKVLRVVQSFDPDGIGARNLKECLLLQLQAAAGRPAWRGDAELARRVIEGHLDDIAGKKLNHIAAALKTTVGAVQAVYDVIRRFDPHPGLRYDYADNYNVWPDVTLVREAAGYAVIVREFDFPRLRINQNYAALFRQEKIDGDARKYLEEKLESALGLIRGIEQRRLNIYKVACCIVEEQREFLEKGVEFLKPLTMSRVADIAGIHESTVSRVVNGKYMQTPRGLLELKYFFNSGLPGAAAGAMSSKSIKHLIRMIITEENPAEPLSDLDIMNRLRQKGIEISRRTVNKYRQSLGIPPNNLRKRYGAF